MILSLNEYSTLRDAHHQSVKFMIV